MVAERILAKKPTKIPREFEIASRARALEAEAAAMITWPSSRPFLEKRGLDAYSRLLVAVAVAAEAGEASARDALAVRAKLAQAAELHWEIVTEYRGLATSSANKIWARTPVGSDIELVDLVQMVRIAMYEAAKRFQPSKGYRFSTYARWWIKAMAERMGMPVFLPSYVRYLKIQVFQHRDRVMREAGRYPTISELVTLTGGTRETITLVLTSTDLPLSLNERASEKPGSDGGAEGSELIDSIPDPRCDVASTDERIDAHRIRQEIELLDQREATVVSYLYGIDAEELSCVEIGRKMGLSRERVRQIGNSALHNIRSRMEAR